MPNLEKNAFVRMRGEEWDLDPITAAHLERSGIIARDYDCEQNTIENGFTDEGPCYGVVGQSESEEEDENAWIVDKVSLVRQR